MAKKCDHKSVGILVWQENRLLLIERKKYPFGFAPPAGHVDNDKSFEDAAKRELKEEVGLTTIDLRLLIEGRMENPCRREGGTWHYWKIYQAETHGEIKPSEDETKQVKLVDRQELSKLAKKTKQYRAGGISEKEWQRRPGLEPVWYDWLKRLGVI